MTQVSHIRTVTWGVGGHPRLGLGLVTCMSHIRTETWDVGGHPQLPPRAQKPPPGRERGRKDTAEPAGLCGFGPRGEGD